MRKTVLTKGMFMKRLKKCKIDCMFAIYNKVKRQSLIINVLYFHYTFLYFWILFFLLSSYYLLKLSNFLFLFCFILSYYSFKSIIHIITIVIITIIIMFINITIRGILERSNQMGESSKRGIQTV